MLTLGVKERFGLAILDGFDHINQLITLSMITLSDHHCSIMRESILNYVGYNVMSKCSKRNKSLKYCEFSFVLPSSLMGIMLRDNRGTFLA